MKIYSFILFTELNNYFIDFKYLYSENQKKPAIFKLLKFLNLFNVKTTNADLSPNSVIIIN